MADSEQGAPPPPPPPLVTADHRGPEVDIAVWICLVISGLAVTAKILTKLGRSQRHVRLANLELDDFVLLSSFVRDSLSLRILNKFAKGQQLFALAQSIAISRQVDAGLGDHISVLPQHRLEGYEKVSAAQTFK